MGLFARIGRSALRGLVVRVLQLEIERLTLRAKLAEQAERKTDAALVQALREEREKRLRVERALSAKDEVLRDVEASRARALADSAALAERLRKVEAERRAS